MFAHQTYLPFSILDFKSSKHSTTESNQSYVVIFGGGFKARRFFQHFFSLFSLFMDFHLCLCLLCVFFVLVKIVVSAADVRMDVLQSIAVKKRTVLTFPIRISAVLERYFFACLWTGEDGFSCDDYMDSSESSRGRRIFLAHAWQ